MLGAVSVRLSGGRSAPAAAATLLSRVASGGVDSRAVSGLQSAC